MSRTDKQERALANIISNTRLFHRLSKEKGLRKVDIFSYH